MPASAPPAIPNFFPIRTFRFAVMEDHSSNSSEPSTPVTGVSTPATELLTPPTGDIASKKGSSVASTRRIITPSRMSKSKQSSSILMTEPSESPLESETMPKQVPSTPPAKQSTTNEESSTPLIKFQTKDHEDILDVLDQLGSEGINNYVTLPQLIVCGDQSSGKSSVLEAISGLKFPAEDGACTRFATELILQRADQIGITVTIQPDHRRKADEKKVIGQVKISAVGLERFAAIIKEIGSYLNPGCKEIPFSYDRLRVRVTGPELPQITLVDLPGLFSGIDKRQGNSDADIVDSLVRSYMEDKRSLILAVVAAVNDIAVQKVTKFVDDIDPKGERTMGIITKPDNLSKGSSKERTFFDLAMNRRCYFRLGWHVLKNRNYEQRHYTLPERNTSESEFLNSGIWTSLPLGRKGIESLRPRLSDILKDHIIDQLPMFISEVRVSSAKTREQLNRLGNPRCEITDQRRYLQRSSERFTSLIAGAIEPAYNDAYFGDALDDEGYEKRLCTVVQDRLSEFNKEMNRNGQQEKIMDDGTTLKDGQISRSDYIEKALKRISRSRGRELSGTFNPLIIGDLFRAQCKPWETIAYDYTGKILDDIKKAVLLALQEALDERSLGGLLEHVINPSLANLGNMLRSETGELLKPHQTGHPITYNHYFTDNIQKARQAHSRRDTADKLKSFFRTQSEDQQIQPQPFRIIELVNALGAPTIADMNWFSCSEAVDCMSAYYKV